MPIVGRDRTRLHQVIVGKVGQMGEGSDYHIVRRGARKTRIWAQKAQTKKGTKEATAKRRQNDRTTKAKIPSDPAKMQRIKELIWQKKTSRNTKTTQGKRAVPRNVPTSPRHARHKTKEPQKTRERQNSTAKTTARKNKQNQKNYFVLQQRKKVTTEQEKHQSSSLHLPHS